MTKGIEHSRNDKKKAQLSLKEKRMRKEEKRASKQARDTVTPDSLQ